MLTGLAGDIDKWNTDFSPSQVDGLVLWLAADLIVGRADGDSVTTWSDLSGNGNDATQATAAQKPLYKVNIVNGRPVVRFDGTDDFLRTAAFSSALVQPSMVFMVADINANVQYSYYDGLTAGARHFFITNGGGANQIRLFAGAALDLSHTHPATMSIWRALFNGASSSLFKNGASVGTGDVGSQNLDGLTIGANYLDGAVLSGDIAELIVYNRALSVAERQQLEGYLGGKYAITVS